MDTADHSHSGKRSSGSRSGKSRTASRSKSTTRKTKKKWGESLLQMAKKKFSKSSTTSSKRVTKRKPRKKSPSTTPSKVSTTNTEEVKTGYFRIAGIDFQYSIKDGKRMINGMPAEDFMGTLNKKQLLMIIHEANAIAQGRDSLKGK